MLNAINSHLKILFPTVRIRSYYQKRSAEVFNVEKHHKHTAVDKLKHKRKNLTVDIEYTVFNGLSAVVVSLSHLT